jgi:hypothetical protein
MLAVIVPALADALIEMARQGIVMAPATAADPDVKPGATNQAAEAAE